MPSLEAHVVTLTDGSKKVVNYPITVAQAVYDSETQEMLSSLIGRYAISVDTIDERDRIPYSQRANHRLVRVQHDEHGNVQYYTWDQINRVWMKEKFKFQVDSWDDVPPELRQSMQWQEIK